MKKIYPLELLILAALLILAGHNTGVAQSRQVSENAQVIERGKFRLHNVLQPTGEERYEVAREGDSIVLKSDFENADRGTKIPLSATLRARADLPPERFEIRGRTSESSTIDSSVVVKGGVATVREGGHSTQATAPARFFTINGFAPVSVQMMLIRYWAAHGKPKRLKTLPGGEVTIEHRGSDTIETDGKQHKLERYSVGGIIWGRETLWLDGQGQLVALITIDSGMNPFEAIREGYEAALPIFVTKATNDRLAALSEISRRFSSEPKDKIAIVGGTMIDATGRPPVSDSVIVIEKNRIVAAGPRSQVKIPKGATVIDARGKAVLPGLWDMHAHVNQVEWGPAYLAAGVTAVRDCGNEFEFEVAVRDAINSGRGIGPRLLLAGFIESDHPDDIGIIRANTPEEARAVVGRYKNASFDQIKIYNSVRPDLVPVITAGAHRLGLTVTGHVPRGMNAFQAVEAGMDQINHIGFIYRAMTRTGANQQGAPPKIDLESAEARRDIQFFKEHGTVVDPTLANYELSLRSTDVPIESFEPSIKKVAKELIAPLRGSGVPPAEAANARTRFEQYLALVGALHRAGVPIVAGSDTWVPGHTLHRELELYVKAGLAPMEAIQAATIVPARAMKMEKEVGTIEVGKRADLIIIDGNPLESVSNIRKVRRVVTNGRIYDCAQLWRSVGFQP